MGPKFLIVNLANGRSPPGRPALPGVLLDVLPGVLRPALVRVAIGHGRLGGTY